MPYTLDPDGKIEIRAHLEKVADRVAEAVASDARRLCPVDTGELVSTITVVQVLALQRQVWVGSDHWLYVEYGTRYMHAQPYMRPAAYRRRVIT